MTSSVVLCVRVACYQSKGAWRGLRAGAVRVRISSGLRLPVALGYAPAGRSGRLLLDREVSNPIRLVTELDKPPVMDNHAYHGGSRLAVAVHRVPSAEVKISRDRRVPASVGVG